MDRNQRLKPSDLRAMLATQYREKSAPVHASPSRASEPDLTGRVHINPAFADMFGAGGDSGDEDEGDFETTTTTHSRAAAASSSPFSSPSSNNKNVSNRGHPGFRPPALNMAAVHAAGDNISDGDSDNQPQTPVVQQAVSSIQGFTGKRAAAFLSPSKKHSSNNPRGFPRNARPTPEKARASKVQPARRGPAAVVVQSTNDAIGKQKREKQQRKMNNQRVERRVVPPRQKKKEKKPARVIQHGRRAGESSAASSNNSTRRSSAKSTGRGATGNIASSRRRGSNSYESMVMGESPLTSSRRVHVGQQQQQEDTSVIRHGRRKGQSRGGGGGGGGVQTNSAYASMFGGDGGDDNSHDGDDDAILFYDDNAAAAASPTRAEAKSDNNHTDPPEGFDAEEVDFYRNLMHHPSQHSIPARSRLHQHENQQQQQPLDQFSSSPQSYHHSDYQNPSSSSFSPPRGSDGGFQSSMRTEHDYDQSPVQPSSSGFTASAYSNGGYSSMQRQKLRFEYKPYSLRDYKDLAQVKELKGGLGPNLDNPEIEKERAKAQRRQRIADGIRKRNAVALAKQKEQARSKPKKESVKVKSKREVAMEFASKIKKPKQRPRPSSRTAPGDKGSSADARRARTLQSTQGGGNGSRHADVMMIDGYEQEEQARVPSHLERLMAKHEQSKRDIARIQQEIG